jgi:RHS repeat-associated protein
MKVRYFASLPALAAAVSAVLSVARSMLPPSLRRVRQLAVSLVLVATLIVGWNGSYVAAAPLPHPHAPAAQGKPNHVNPTRGTKSTLHFLPPNSKLPSSKPFSQRPAMSHGFIPTMKADTLPIDPTQNTQFLGSDGRLEVDVPAGAVTAADVSAAGGALSLQVSEVAPPSGSNAGGAISLGTYEIDVVDATGAIVSQFANGLRKPWTLELHFSGKDTTVDLTNAFVTINAAHPKTSANVGPYSSLATTFDSTNNILQAQVAANPALVTPAAAGSATPSVQKTAQLTAAAQSTPPNLYIFNTYASVAKFGSPDPLNADLTAGSLTEGIQLDVPPGPAGAMPNITLAYNSGAVSEQHNPQGAAGWVGEGWSLSLGAISWSEHNVAPTCSSHCANDWESQWMLTDPFGTSTELIPPNLAASTYYDDSNNWWCTTGNSAADTCPIQFHTANESYAKIYAYVGPNYVDGAPDPLACFRVYLTNGVMEEFGCTADSIQYYPLQANSMPGQQLSNVPYPVNYLLDLITNPQGDQVHITYQSDTETAPDGLSDRRDTVPSTIEWDSPTCVNATQMCTGSSSPNLWAPHYRVQFVASHHTVAHLTNSPSGCNTDTSVRCDDPTNVSGGVSAPLVNGTFVLNDAKVQVYNSSTWNTVRDYQFSYEQSGPTTQTDPVTGKSISYAGYLDLTQLQEVGDDTSTAYPPTSFTYTSQDEYYEDGSFTPYSTTFCGPSWNTGGNGGTCDLWSQTYAGNDRYLATISNGQGLQESISWELARNNTHGVPGGAGPNNANPLYCNNPSYQASYPCNSADDQAWSRVVVQQRSDTVNQITQAGQGGTQTTTPVTSTTAYTYTLPYPLVAQECGDCVAGMYWGNQNDGDYLDYYNGHFMGFAQTSVSNPDGSIVNYIFEPTMGWGVYDTSKVTSCISSMPPVNTTCHNSPWWNVANAGHGLETETDYYDTNGTTLLKKVTNSYTTVCPPSNVSATPQYNDGGTLFGPWDGNLVSELDHSNPVADCDVQLSQQVTSAYDGTTNAVSETDSYTYDSYGQVNQTQRVTANGASSPTTIYDNTFFIRNDGLTVPTAARSTTNQENAWAGVYLIDLPALQVVDDAANGGGNRYSCHYTNYDGQGYHTSQYSLLTQGNVTEQDTYTGCGTSPNYTPSGKLGATATFDSYGNLLSRTDPDANNGDASHTITSGPCATETTCVTYNPTSEAQLAQSESVNNLSTASNGGADNGQGAGYGLWPTSTTDANGQTTTYTYDPLGRQLTMRLPGQQSPVTPATQATAYWNWCAATGAGTPCVEVEMTKRIDSSHSVTTRQFYDGENRVVETRTAAPGGQDVVQYTLYNAAGQAATASVSYFVTAYTGTTETAASNGYSIPDSSQSVTTTTYDGLGRVTQTTDPLSNVSKISYTVACNAPGTGDATCYEETLGVDANGHQVGGLSDGFGRSVYAQTYTGNSPATYAVYRTTKTIYDYNGNTVQSVQPNGTSATVSSYDAAGRLTSVADPDRGLTSYLYDPNGNQTEQIDARCGTSLPQTACSAGTTYSGYDGLNRPIWRNSGASNPGGAYVTYSYDGSPFSNGLGRLTAEVFRSSSGTSATSFSGAYTYQYDSLGRTTQVDQTMGGAGACPTGWTCQDIGGPGLAGGQSYAGDSVWTLQGGGADIWNTSDQFHYVSQSLSGDATISAQVASQTNTHAWAKAGLMVRASNAANAAYYAVYVTPGNGVSVQYRDSTGGSAAFQVQSVAGAAPASVAVNRIGTTYTAYMSIDGTNWTLIQGSARTMSNLSGSTLVGLVAASHDNTTVTTATFDNVTITTGGAGVCPTNWTCQDIGSPSPAGSQSYLGDGVWNLSGSGSDIWGTSDQFHYVSQNLSSGGSLSAHVETETNTNAWAKAGLMIRASNAANAAYYAVYVTPGNGISVQYRDSTGGTAAFQVQTVSGATPAYLQVNRNIGTGGTTYTAATSTDGKTWTTISGSSRTMSNLTGTLLLGLVVCSHNAGTLLTATFDQITTTPTVPSGVTVTTPPVPSGITSYPIQTAYNDASMPTQTTYSDSETLGYSYDSGSAWLSGLTATPHVGTATQLLSSVNYSGAGGAAGHITSASVGGGTYNYAASYDADVRLSSLSLTRTSDHTLLFSSQRGYDGVGNVTGVLTTLPAGTDSQAYCYDEQNRLVWATSATATGPCGAANTAGTLTSAQYTQTDSYDTLDRLTSGPLGSYTYGDSAHLHAVTSIGSAPTYTASYDAAGNMTCRAPTSATTCTGTPTGAQLSFDTEGRLAQWASGVTTDTFLYDGNGNRIEQATTTGSSTVTTTYVAGGQEEIASNGSTTTLTKYFPGPNGLPTAERIGTTGSLTYLASDGQGSVSSALDSNGNVTFQQLYTPYGTVRYTNGSAPTSYAYTGQMADSATGLDYYHARYYDPVAQQFVSADTMQVGLSRYGYVGGNPTTNVDPSGHHYICDPSDPSNCPPPPGHGGGGHGGGGNGNPKYDKYGCQFDPFDPDEGKCDAQDIARLAYELYY